MKSFENNKLAAFAIYNGLAKALEEANTGHGAEVNLATTQPQLLSRLRERAIISSSIASCSIENIRAPEFERLVLAPEPLRPYNREEKHLANYKTALDFIYTTPSANLKITPEFIRHLHNLVMADSPDAGEYKGRDNQIVEKTPRGLVLRFKPVSALDTPHYLEQLCLHYNQTLQKGESPVLLAIAALVLDFTAIHPFYDGNGRVSRVLTSAALLSQGFQMPKFISLEEIIDADTDPYYRALQLSSEHWHQGAHNLEPFLTFQTQTIARGYRDFGRMRERTDEPITVVFHDKLSPSLRDQVCQELLMHYPRAVFKTAQDGVKEVQIEGYRSELPHHEWEPLQRADKLVRHLVARAKNREARRAAAGEGESGRDDRVLSE